MNADRFEVLAGRLLDGELAAVEADELAVELRSNPAHRRELRQQLIAWELWSQQQAPERSAEAFLRALHTRQRAEQEGDAFVEQLRSRLRIGQAAAGRQVDSARKSPLQFVSDAWDAVRRHRQLWMTAMSAVAAALAVLVWLSPHQAHASVTLHGEAICTACTLHETHAHLPAIRVHEGNRTVIYYVNSGRFTVMRLGDYCLAPLPLVATGATELRGGRHTIDVDHAKRTPRAPTQDERVLFPF